MSEQDFAKRVQKYFDKKDYKTALKIVNQEGTKYPDSPYVLYGRGYALFHLKKYKKALDAFKEYVANKRANYYLGYSFLAECYKEIKKYEDAIPFFKKSLEYNPKFERSLFGLEYCYRMLNDLDNAFQANLSITQHYGRESQSWYWLSVISLIKNEIIMAYSYVLRALRHGKDDTEIKQLYKEIQDRYEEKEKPEATIDALKEITFGKELAYGKIELNDRGIESIDKIESLDITRLNLFQLFLNHNEIEDISRLNGFEELGYLELSDNKITTLKNFGNLPKLTSLKLEGNNIEMINGLFDLPRLILLDLSDNEISKIEGLHNLKLVSLNLSNNQIQIIEGLEQQNKLQTLKLANNQITDINSLRNLTSLKFLDLSHNNISSLQGLEKLPNLLQVNLTNNPNLPELLAKIHNGPEEIAKLRPFCNLSSKELLQRSEEMFAKIREHEMLKQKMMKEKLERHHKERREREKRKTEQRINEILAPYSVRQKINSKLHDLVDSTKESQCSYCKKTIPANYNFIGFSALIIDQLVEETVSKLPKRALDRNNYIERKVTYEVTNRRMDIYDRPGTTTVTRVVREYKDTSIKYYNTEHFPKLLGSVCKDCSAYFIKRATRIFNRLQRRKFKAKHFSDTIKDKARKCHENYMKLFESMLEKRG